MSSGPVCPPMVGAGIQKSKKTFLGSFSLVDTLEKSWNTVYDWILKWYPLIKSEGFRLINKDLAVVSQTDESN